MECEAGVSQHRICYETYRTFPIIICLSSVCSGASRFRTTVHGRSLNEIPTGYRCTDLQLPASGANITSTCYVTDTNVSD